MKIQALLGKDVLVDTAFGRVLEGKLMKCDDGYGVRQHEDHVELFDHNLISSIDHKLEGKKQKPPVIHLVPETITDVKKLIGSIVGLTQPGEKGWRHYGHLKVVKGFLNVVGIHEGCSDAMPQVIVTVHFVAEQIDKIEVSPRGPEIHLKAE